ncbi:MAG: hypothetical protein GX904_04455 [Acholeplasmataceae bacterium]|nr:hypothetical protein [Acholeplasmataceae bacterium]
MNKLGLCLSGGGARGAFQVGACKALEDLGILKKVNAYAGTSIGSVNASLISTKSVDEVFRIWLSVEPDVLKSTESLFKRIIKERTHFVDNGVFKIDELEVQIDAAIDYNHLRQQELYITISQAGNINDGIFGLFKAGYQHYIKKDSQALYVPVSDQSDEQIKKLILASCSIPIVFPAVRLDEREYFDGAVFDNVPVKPLVDSGCDTVIIVHLHRLNLFQKSNFPGIRFYEIKHHRSLGGLLNFDRDRSRKLFDLGYHNAFETLKDSDLVG